MNLKSDETTRDIHATVATMVGAIAAADRLRAELVREGFTGFELHLTPQAGQRAGVDLKLHAWKKDHPK